MRQRTCYPALLRRAALSCMALLGLAGCASLPFDAPGVSTAVAPERVAGLRYAQMEELGALRGACAHLQDMRKQGRRVRQQELDEQLLPACERQIQAAQDRLARQRQEAEEQAIAEMMAREWAWVQEQAALRRSREAEWREAERQRQEAELLRAQLAVAEQAQAERRAALAQRIMSTQVQQALADYEDKPIAHSMGQPSATTLKTFLACIELAYPNKGYRVSQSGRTLTVIARQAQLPRGDLPIEARFVENANYWRMTYLMVADIEARSDADRFVLSQNLVAEACPQEGGLF
ncbi:hypothetical protein [Isoalcanivorax indicus]|uniref:hypothetical protein n=1 Tax=Isoalcanivorax indicus TaxID=2202653 RepID=UPI000DB9A5FB|nr:hypothetical protein [Isoalcanivorax indicus]